MAVATRPSTARPTATSPGSKIVYKGRSGQWAFVGHRISGFLVFMFLLLHIVDVLRPYLGGVDAFGKPI